MRPLYTNEKFSCSKSRELLPFECQNCKKTFYRSKNKVQAVIRGNSDLSLNYCSCQCNVDTKKTKIHLICNHCSKFFTDYPNRKFCSRSCAGKYNNAHKTKGCRRSKLEKWIEKELTKKYPNLHIDYNKTNAINAELDIYIPSLKLAFELNGIFHYEPIYGENKLSEIQNNDGRKFQACLEQRIELCIIDTSSQKYFKEKTSQKYLDIIINIIEKKL